MSIFTDSKENSLTSNNFFFSDHFPAHSKPVWDTPIRHGIYEKENNNECVPLR